MKTDYGYKLGKVFCQCGEHPINALTFNSEGFVYRGEGHFQTRNRIFMRLKCVDCGMPLTFQKVYDENEDDETEVVVNEKKEQGI